MKSIYIIPALASLTTADQGFGAGPSENLALFQAANQHPNATGSVELSGTNMTAPPDEYITAFWTASLNITSITGADESNASLSVINSVISLNANDNFVPNTTWDTCVVILQSVARNATVKGQNDPGDCAETFGKECVDSWAEALSQASIIAAQSNLTGPCNGISLSIIPEACQGLFEVQSAIYTDIISPNQTDGSAFYYNTDDPHDPSNITAYELAATRIWPIALLQNSVRGKSGGETNVEMSCLRATNTTKGSEKIGGVPGAGSKVVSGAWALLVAVGVLGVLF